jgi:hypothetical protein
MADTIGHDRHEGHNEAGAETAALECQDICETLHWLTVETGACYGVSSRGEIRAGG